MNPLGILDLQIFLAFSLICVGVKADSTTESSDTTIISTEQSTQIKDLLGETTTDITTTDVTTTPYVLTTSMTLQTQASDPEDYVTFQTYWISTGILIAVVALLLAATTYLLVVHFRRRGSPNNPSITLDSNGHRKLNNYTKESTLQCGSNDNLDGKGQPEAAEPNFDINPEQGVPNSQTSTDYLRDTREPSIVEQYQDQVSIETSARNHEPSKYERPIGGRKNHDNDVPSADVASYPNTPLSATSKSQKPTLLPKPTSNQERALKSITDAESKPTIADRKKSLAHSDDGYDNDSTTTPPLPKPNLPKRNPRLKLEDPGEVYENEAYYDDVDV